MATDLEDRLEELFMRDSNGRRVTRVDIASRPSPWRGALAFTGAAVLIGVLALAAIAVLRGDSQVAGPRATSSPTPTTHATPSLSALTQIRCGQVSGFVPATANTTGSFTLTSAPPTGPVRVIIPAGTQISGLAGYACVELILGAPASGFAGLVTPGMPGYVPEAATTSTPAPAATMGTVGGKLYGYGSDHIPALAIYALPVSNTSDGRIVTFTERWAGSPPETQGGGSYTLSVPPGTYYVVGYARTDDGSGWATGYTRYVTCGRQQTCTDHSLVPVTVTAGQTLSSIDLTDWMHSSSPGYPFPPRPS